MENEKINAELILALEALLRDWRGVCELNGWDVSHLNGHDMAVKALKNVKGE